MLWNIFSFQKHKNNSPAVNYQNSYEKTPKRALQQELQSIRKYYDAYHAIYGTHRIYKTLLQSPASNQYRATLRTIHLQDTLNIILSKTSIIFFTGTI